MKAAQRRRNLADAFTCRRPCDNLNIAVLDDVFTTGATAGAAARALREAGAQRVEIWCLARTPVPGEQ
jgi:predicted amidophosphoribosyltransferase